MKKKLKVFIATSSFNQSPSNFKKEIEIENYEFLKNPLKKKLTNQQLIKYAKDCEFIIAGTESYNKDTINKLSKLKYLFRMGSGVDNVDINYLKKKKIKFSKSKVTPEIAVAELIAGYILSFYRNIHEHDMNLKNKIWKKKMGNIFNGKTLGIIGYGKVGSYLHKIIECFGVKILINDIKKIGKKNTKLNTLIKNSDIISINMNYSKQKKLLNKKRLNLCKKNCLIINTSRSDIIDNNYLFQLLKKNKIFGACMDVFDTEPYYGKFTNLNNVILTPHIGSYSSEIRSEMEIEALRHILSTKIK